MCHLCPNMTLVWPLWKIFALQAEALLKLRRHQDAEKVMSKCPNLDVDECTKFFGPIGNANLLVIRAQVDLAAGRLVCVSNHFNTGLELLLERKSYSY